MLLPADRAEPHQTEHWEMVVPRMAWPPNREPAAQITAAAKDRETAHAHRALSDRRFGSHSPESSCVAECFGQAVALQQLSRWDEAIALYERVLQVRPQCQDALINLIALHVERFDLRRVEQFALELLRQDPGSLIALQALTMVSYERRNYEKAAEYFFQWEASLPERGLAAGDDAIQYRLSRESVERLAELRLNQWPTNQSSGQDRGY